MAERLPECTGHYGFSAPQQKRTQHAQKPFLVIDWLKMISGNKRFCPVIAYLLARRRMPTQHLRPEVFGVI
jgi:hypothetical protein